MACTTSHDALQRVACVIGLHVILCLVYLHKEVRIAYPPNSHCLVSQIEQQQIHLIPFISDMVTTYNIQQK